MFLTHKSSYLWGQLENTLAEVHCLASCDFLKIWCIILTSPSAVPVDFLKVRNMGQNLGSYCLSITSFQLFLKILKLELVQG